MRLITSIDLAFITLQGLRYIPQLIRARRYPRGEVSAAPPFQFRELGRGTACAISELRLRLRGMSNMLGMARITGLDSSRGSPRTGASRRDKGSPDPSRAARISSLAHAGTPCMTISTL